MLEVGSKAPELQLEDSSGHTLRLSEYQGKSNVLVYFMRTTDCLFCNRHVRDLAARKGELAKDDIEVIIAVPEGREVAAAWKAQHDIPFRVVTGQQGSVHEAVGLTVKMFGSVQQSGSILVDSTGLVRHAHSASVPAAAYDKKGIAQAIQGLPRTV